MGSPPLPRPRAGYFEVIPPDPAVLTYRQPANVELHAWVAAVEEIEAECWWPANLYDRWEIRQADGGVYYPDSWVAYGDSGMEVNSGGMFRVNLGDDRYPGESEPPPDLPLALHMPYSVIHPQSVVET